MLDQRILQKILMNNFVLKWPILNEIGVYESKKRIFIIC